MKCTHCEEEKYDVIGGLCEECEQDFIYCSVCDEWIYIDNALYKHRHLFYYEGLWLGTGGENVEGSLDKIKVSFQLILKKTGIGKPLRDTILRQDMGFDTIHFYGSMMGPMSLWCWLQEDGQGHGYGYGDRFVENLTKEEEDNLTLGVWWLIGLDNEKTPEANKTTLNWISEWLEGNGE